MKKKKLTAAEAAEAADRKLQAVKLFCERIGISITEKGTALKKLMKRSKNKN